MTIRDDLRWGLGIAAFFIAFYALIAVVLYFLRGADSFEAQGLSLPRLLLAYLGGGVVAGCILGLLRPLTRWRLGAALVGVAVALPVFLGIGLALFGMPSTWDSSVWGAMVGAAVLLGSVGGADSWKQQ
jgi:hypothetical protein